MLSVKFVVAGNVDEAIQLGAMFDRVGFKPDLDEPHGVGHQHAKAGDLSLIHI